MIYDRINLMLPTYKRVHRGPDGAWTGLLAEFCQTSMQSTERPTSEVVDFTFMINKNDLVTLEFLQERMNGYKFHILMEDEPKPHLAKYFNCLYAETRFCQPGTLVSLLGDDMRFETKGYDQKILAKANEFDGNCLVYCNDGYIAGERCCVNLFTSRQLVEATEKPFMKASCKAEMMDDIWMKITRTLNIHKYLSDVIILHNHDDQRDPSQRDETWNRLNPVRQQAHDTRDFNEEQAYINEIVKTLRGKGVGQPA